ncbi:MAG: OB-fold domain-containing protein [Gammaproteobacteria bacterium AqS3]|nr:OB-fold domain-containing protein [Gammaproteobacteria bacterium AqS3]
MAETLPVVPWLHIEEDGAHWLEGMRCSECGAMFLGHRENCSSCGARGSLKSEKLSETGTLHAFSIVHRSYPGIDVPYISAIVDLDGGGTIKGNIINVEPQPENLSFGMPLRVVFGDALGRKDADGNNYISYFFEPVS